MKLNYSQGKVEEAKFNVSQEEKWNIWEIFSHNSSCKINFQWQSFMLEIIENCLNWKFFLSLGLWVLVNYWGEQVKAV